MEQVKHFVIKGADIQLHPTNPVTIAHLPKPSIPLDGNSSYVSTNDVREEVVEGMEFEKAWVVPDEEGIPKPQHEKFYVGYTEDIPEPLKAVFRSLWTCRYNNERHVHRNALLKQQLKACSDRALMKIRMVSNLSFWQRLKFLFTRKIECIKGYFDE